MSVWWKIVFGVVCGLLAGGLILLVSQPRRGAAIVLQPPPTPEPMIVHVAGAVAQPGVYSLAPGSRVEDAIRAAGGFSADANSSALNLAALVQDGERVMAPTLPPAITAGAPAVRSGTAEPLLEAGQLININTASQTELESLPGIGPVTAQQIIAYREANGPFAQIEDLMDVPGIGEKTFEKIRDLITV
ncbi:MAG: ComEA family DNA-binding protein [Anaerolineales bacterium]|nr:ComEA family DNA-binding protein [Anaerolineales bacterium]